MAERRGGSEVDD
jgi:hypothetical protein